MSLQQLEKHVAELPPEELKAFSQWFDDFMAEAWDQQMERDAKAGKFDKVLARLDVDFTSGKCQEL